MKTTIGATQVKQRDKDPGVRMRKKVADALKLHHALRVKIALDGEKLPYSAKQFHSSSPQKI